MKSKYIQSLLTEIQLLESKVAGLKDNKTVPFSFFKEAFKQTQEIMRLLHTLEFVQIEDMKGQMEKLVQFLSEASEQTESSKKEHDESEIHTVESESNHSKHVGIPPSVLSSSSEKVSDLEIKEDFPLFEEDSETKPTPLTSDPKTKQESDYVKESATDDSQINPLHAANKSLNDMQPANHTIMDSKRSISLNDRFLFQRELFNNDRLAMNNMMIKMQSFTTFADCKKYLESNTDWDFKDETVEKFLDLLKEGF